MVEKRLTVRRLHTMVSGRVQGVFFRAHAKKWADELGLRGFVQNLPDGSVEIVAEGEEAKLQSLLQKVSAGPPAAKVENVQISWKKPTHEFVSFEVRR